MEKTWAVILISLIGLMSLIIGVVILVRKQYFSYGKKGQFIRKVAGKRARSDGITYIVMGLIFLGLSAAIYLWGG